MNIKDWIKQPKNYILVGILILAFLIRLYLFTLTINQPVWWDEAEYMVKAKNIAFGTPDSGWMGEIRPLGLPVLSSLLFKLGLGEVGIRFLWIILSVLSIFFVYKIAKNLFNNEIGLISCFVYSTLYLDLFYVTRLLVDVPQMFFITLALYLFTEVYFNNGNRKLIYLILPIIFLGTTFRFTVGIIAFVLLVFLLTTQGLKLFKEKEWYISTILGVLTFLPYMIYSQITFGNPIKAITYVLFTGEGQRASNPFSVLMEYINYIPSYFHIFFLILLLIGLVVLLFNMIISFDKIRNSSDTKRNYFIILLVLIPLLFFGLYINHFEDRYIFMIFPFVSILIAYGLLSIHNLIAKYYKVLAISFVVFVLLFAAYNDFQKSDTLIKSKIESYNDFKFAGEWIKSVSSIDDKVYSTGQPQVTYYSEREVISFPQNQSEFDLYDAKFYVVSLWEKSPDWVYEYFSQERNDIGVVKVYYLNKNPSTIVYVRK